MNIAEVRRFLELLKLGFAKECARGTCRCHTKEECDRRLAEAKLLDTHTQHQTS